MALVGARSISTGVAQDSSATAGDASHHYQLVTSEERNEPQRNETQRSQNSIDSDHSLPSVPEEWSEVIFEFKDCFALTVVNDVSLAISLPIMLLVACVQGAALFFLSLANENLFADGRWLEPTSKHQSVNVVKGISIAVSVFKLSTEFGMAQQLSRAVCLLFKSGNTSRAISGAIAAITQYAMATMVLFVAIHLVLAQDGASACLLRVLSIWIVIDIDNMAIRLIELWTQPLLFEVKRPPFSVHSHPWLERVVFIAVPLVLLASEITYSITYQVLPMTMLWHGSVSNVAAPSMIIGLQDGCCPPIATDHISNYGNYSVMLMGPAGASPPTVFWVAIESTKSPIPPTSLQIMEGVDSNMNPAPRRGSASSQSVQAYFWLQQNGFGEQAYTDMLRDMKLYRGNIPYEASFELNNLKPFGVTYHVFVTARNDETMALAVEPAKSLPLITSICAMHCHSCRISGPGRCDQCEVGTHKKDDENCLPCPNNCDQCDDDVAQCDKDKCQLGYGRDLVGNCIPCLVDNCDACESVNTTAINGSKATAKQVSNSSNGKNSSSKVDIQICAQCQRGFGMSDDGLGCSPCAHEHCICSKAGECSSCGVGFGLTSEGDCAICKDGCADCTTQDSCLGCQAGYSKASSGSCERCAPMCEKCAKAGPGNCDECAAGYGWDGWRGRCVKCASESCLHCKTDAPNYCEQCKEGYGVTPEGDCESCGNKCLRCNFAGKCGACLDGFGLATTGKCLSCADRCSSCAVSGPARCDQGACYQGFVLENVSLTCKPKFDDSASAPGFLHGVVPSEM